MKQLTIGNVTLDNCYVLGPMAGVTGRRSVVHGNDQCKRDFI